MSVSSSDSSGAFAQPEAFVGLNCAGEVTPGVAALDSTTVQQTKSEIRSLAAEIAQLANSPLSPDDFYEGFLPRLCAAMGAKAAAIWRFRSDGPIGLLAGHALPNALLDEAVISSSPSQENVLQNRSPETSAVRAPRCPSESHLRILRCVAAEGQPVLVPPASVTVDADRPSNPLAECLIIIPVRVRDDVEYLLEVVQRPSGGPAAQRGYLRFVAQMADLLADFLRRQQLREFSDQRQRLARIEDWLTALASTKKRRQRQQIAADALLDLFAADRVILIANLRRSTVLSISGARTFDPRSEIVLAAEALHRQLTLGPGLPATCDAAQHDQDRSLWLNATDRRSTNSSANGSTGTEVLPQAAIDAFLQSTACRQAILIPLDSTSHTSALLAYADQATCPPCNFSSGTGPEQKLLHSIGTLLEGSDAQLEWSRLWQPAWLVDAVFGRPRVGGGTAGRAAMRQATIQMWLLRLALFGLAGAIAFFPVSQQISATAVLQPRSKQMYYAPAAGVVGEVLTDEGDVVAAGAVLMRLTSHELQTQAENLQIEIEKTQGQFEEKTSRLNRGDHLTAFEKDQLEYELRELETTLRSLQIQRSYASERLGELSITARQSGTIATWDLKNRLLNHPVQPGQLLTSTFDPSDEWRLQLSIPDYRAGLVAEALERSTQGALQVHFSLASHPDQILEAYAVGMAPQVTALSTASNATSSRVVKTEARIRNTDDLPLRKDGAIARATIDCGKVPLCWLVVRDAYWAVSSRVRMLW